MDRNEFPVFMSRCANSHEILINEFLEKKDILVPKTLGRKITKLAEAIKGTTLSFNKEEFILSLKKFNSYWNITKHGMEILNVPFAYVKDGTVTEFNDKLIETIGSEFTENQKKLIEICSND